MPVTAEKSCRVQRHEYKKLLLVYVKVTLKVKGVDITKDPRLQQKNYFGLSTFSEGVFVFLSNLKGLKCSLLIFAD